MSDRAFESVRKGWVATLTIPAYRVLWRRFRGDFDPSFSAWIDEQVAQAKFTPPAPAEHFNNALAAELAAMNKHP